MAFLIPTLLSAFFSPLVLAIVQGSLGSTSTMIINVQIEIARELRIFNLDSITLGTFDFSQSQVQGQDTFCVYDNGSGFGAGFTYNITFTGTNNPSAFVLRSGGQDITYQVEYDDSQSGANFRTASPGVAITSNVNASTSSLNCFSAGGNNGTVRITVLRTDAAPAASSTYTDTLTIVVAPDA